MFTLTNLKTILVDRIGIPEGDIPDDLATAFTDLGMDSLAIVEVQLAIQQEYGIKITDADASDLQTFAGVLRFVNERLDLAKAA